MVTVDTNFTLQTKHRLNGKIVIMAEHGFSTPVQMSVRDDGTRSGAGTWVFLTDEDIDDLITVLLFYRKTGRVEP
jgi:hypothetical protein